MKKPVHKHRKVSNKTLNYVIIGTVAVTVILIVALAVANSLEPDPSDYIVTADGHVHAEDGTHIGEAADMFGENYVVTEDGHVHTAGGTHVGTYTEAEDDHDHAEEDVATEDAAATEEAAAADDAAATEE